MNFKFYLVILISVIILSSPGIMRGKDKVIIQVNPDNAKFWYLYCPTHSLNFYFMRIWPGNLMVTRFGPPAIQVSRGFSLAIVAGPDLLVKASDFKSLFEALNIDVIPTIIKKGFAGTFINEIGINKDGRAVYLFRHTIICKGLGVRWAANGIIGRNANFFKIGPVYQFGQIQVWVADDILTGKWMIETSFQIKI